MKVIVILNRRAGVIFRPFRRTSPEAVHKAFAAEGITPEIRKVTPDDLPRALEQAVSDKPDAIVVAGGDGTVNTAATILGGSGIPLAVLPQGTFNIFARHMGLPFTVAQTARLLKDGHNKLLDVGSVNERAFTLFSSIGVYPQFVRERKVLQHRRGWWKPFAMLWALGKAIVRFPRLTLRLQVDGKTLELHTASIIVATSPGALTPLRILEDGARYLTDKTLYLYVGRHCTRLGMVKSFLKILFTRPELDQDFDMHPVQSFSVEVQGVRRLLAAGDGELFRLEAPLNYLLKPKHLRVFLPRPE